MARGGIVSSPAVLTLLVQIPGRILRIALRTMAFWLPVLVILAWSNVATPDVPIRWYGWSDWSHNVGQFVPSILVPYSWGVVPPVIH